MSRNDPHADIQLLCDALSVAILALAEEEILIVPDEAADAINRRLSALEGGDRIDVLQAGIDILKRSRAVH